MYTMKQVCDRLDMTYETLRFYCDEGLVPHHKREEHNYRVFDDRDVRWLSSLQCLKRCGMRIKDMKAYMCLCQQGASTIHQRKRILAEQKSLLVAQLADMQKSVDFIDAKQAYFDAVLRGDIAYTSNLIDVEA